MVRQRLSTLDSYQRNKVSNQTCFSEMQNYLPEKPNKIMLIDFYGPLPSPKGGFKYILSNIDALSKFVVLYPLRRSNTKAVNTWWSWIKITESCMNETHHETTEFTPIELHLDKKPKRAWENWLNFPPHVPETNYEKK